MIVCGRTFRSACVAARGALRCVCKHLFKRPAQPILSPRVSTQVCRLGELGTWGSSAIWQLGAQEFSSVLGT
eukprot:10809355-Alexandrium_andersonii.AAC.1